MQSTDRMRDVFNQAQKFARSMHHEYIGCEHMLHALIGDVSGVAINVLRDLCDVASVVVELKSMTKGPEMVTVGRLPITPRLRKATEIAEEFAVQLGNSYLNTEHMIVGIVCEGESAAAQILKNKGIDETAIVHAVRGILEGPLNAAKKEESRSLVVSMIRCQDALCAIRGEGEADLMMAVQGMSEAIRWFTEYRIRMGFNSALSK